MSNFKSNKFSRLYSLGLSLTKASATLAVDKIKNQSQSFVDQHTDLTLKIKATKELAARKARTLKKFGLTVAQLNKLRRQNRDYSLKTKSPRLLYNLALDEDVNNWSNERIGYIKNYNDVFVNPSARRTYAQRKRAYDKIEQWDLFSDYQELFDYSKSGHEAPKAA